jgi:hypothetical protein
MLFKEIMAVYIESHTKPINPNVTLLIVKSTWYIWIPLGFKCLIGFWRQYCRRTGNDERLITPVRVAGY